MASGPSGLKIGPLLRKLWAQGHKSLWGKMDRRVQRAQWANGHEGHESTRYKGMRYIRGARA